jgi:hypothetical protein
MKFIWLVCVILNFLVVGFEVCRGVTFVCGYSAEGGKRKKRKGKSKLLVGTCEKIFFDCPKQFLLWERDRFGTVVVNEFMGFTTFSDHSSLLPHQHGRVRLVYVKEVVQVCVSFPHGESGVLIMEHMWILSSSNHHPTFTLHDR